MLILIYRSLHKVIFQGPKSVKPKLPRRLETNDIDRLMTDLAIHEGMGPEDGPEDGNNGSDGFEGAGAGAVAYNRSTTPTHLPARRLLKSLSNVGRRAEESLIFKGSMENGKGTVPIIERARRVYYPPGTPITQDMQDTADLGEYE
jgi:hypothetical protein